MVAVREKFNKAVDLVDAQCLVRGELAACEVKRGKPSDRYL